MAAVVLNERFERPNEITIETIKRSQLELCSVFLCVRTSQCKPVSFCSKLVFVCPHSWCEYMHRTIQCYHHLHSCAWPCCPAHLDQKLHLQNPIHHLPLPLPLPSLPIVLKRPPLLPNARLLPPAPIHLPLLCRRGLVAVDPRGELGGEERADEDLGELACWVGVLT